MPHFSGERQNVSKLYFLVHPGYLSEEEDVELGRKLLARYEEQASALNRDALMMLFAPTDREGLQEDLRSNKPYIRTIHRLRTQLRERLVVTAPSIHTLLKPESLACAQHYAEARGFSVRPDVPTEAWGEPADFCAQVAAHLNRNGGFSRRTVFNAQLTDLFRMDPKAVAKYVREELYEDYKKSVIFTMLEN